MFDPNILTQKSVRNLYYLLHKTSTVNDYTISLLKSLNTTFLIYPELTPNIMYISDWRIALSVTNSNNIFIHVDKNKYKIAWDLTWDIICSIKMNVNWDNCNNVTESPIRESLQEFLQEPEIPGVILEESSTEPDVRVILEESSTESDVGVILEESSIKSEPPVITPLEISIETPKGTGKRKTLKISFIKDKFIRMILCR